MEQVKITDLSVGDWVDIYGKVSQIRKISKVDFSGLITICGASMPYGLGAVRPIPITQEILERNGFVENLGRWYNSECFMELEPNEGAWDRTINCGEYSVYTIKYVHQLQHALRLAGANKEIRL